MLNHLVVQTELLLFQRLIDVVRVKVERYDALVLFVLLAVSSKGIT